MHDTMTRLYEAARTLRGVDTQTEVARLMGTSPQVVSNWEKRGISKEGLLTAQERIGCRAEWVKYGKGFMSSFGTDSQVGGVPPRQVLTQTPTTLYVHQKDYVHIGSRLSSGRRSDR